MYHIVFNVNDGYIKYLSVLLYSIVKNTDNTGGGGFVFHILTDGLKHETEQKLQALETKLNEIYPCELHIYTLSDSVFQGLPKLNDNYLTYFRLKMATYLPKEIKTCLYLDVDMLCVSDIREIFYKDLQGKICGVVLDAHYLPSRIMPSINGGNGFSLNIDTYFNAGLILIDLEKYRNHNIEQKCFEWLKCYTPIWHDQDTLNAVLSDSVCILPLEWNFMTGHLENKPKSDFKGESKEFGLNYTYQEYIKAKNNVKILHYLTATKPWHTQRCAYRSEWWKQAFNTPIFDKELQTLYIQEQETTFYNLKNRLLSLLKTGLKKIFKF